MNGNFALYILRTLIAAAIVAAITMLWNLDRQVALNTDKISQVLQQSNKQDTLFETKLSQIEQSLNELKNRNR
jgi:hypothetical protein